MKKITNIDKTTQVVYINGQRVDIEPGKSILMESTPGPAHIFKVEEVEEPKNKIKGGK